MAGNIKVINEMPHKLPLKYFLKIQALRSSIPSMFPPKRDLFTFTFENKSLIGKLYVCIIIST